MKRAVARIQEAKKVAVSEEASALPVLRVRSRAYSYNVRNKKISSTEEVEEKERE